MREDILNPLLVTSFKYQKIKNPGTSILKLFTVVLYCLLQKASVLVSGRLLHPAFNVIKHISLLRRIIIYNRKKVYCICKPKSYM
jgi:hypothetical protein